MKSRQTFIGSVKASWNGFRYIFIHQRNIRIHVVVAAAVMVAAWGFSLSRLEWMILIEVIALVIVLESLNSVAEFVADLLEPRIHQAVKIVKDVAAASVLVASIASVIIGFLLFWPHIF